MPIDEIEVIKQKLVDQIKPIGVYLFGSFANGTAHKMCIRDSTSAVCPSAALSRAMDEAIAETAQQ